MKKMLMVSLAVAITGCTSIQVQNNDGFQSKSLKQICIVSNPKVKIEGFVQSITRSFERHGISARVYPGSAEPVSCEATLTYTALRSWDFVPYMSYAKFTLMKDGNQVSEAEFKLKGKGGLALNKWRSTDIKIDELVDQIIGENTPK